MEAVAAFCRRHRVRELALFGSVLRDDFTDHSDVDVLIEPGPDHDHTLDEMLSMQEELETLFGRSVDLVYKDLLDKYIREDVLKRRRVFYVATQ
jgi:predicted nucleotidyltransferase